MRVGVVIPNWNGRRWLPDCLAALAAQTQPPEEVVIVDNGSSDGSPALAAGCGLPVRVLELGRNTGFAFAANRGIEAVGAEAVAMLNTDVVLREEWLARMTAVLAADPGLSGVACKMLDMEDPRKLYDAGDFLRRDGACEQRGRYQTDDRRFDAPGEAFAPCAGAALYRRSAVLSIGGFDERLFSYLEDVDLGLRLEPGGLALRVRTGGRRPRRRRLLVAAAAAGGPLDRAQHAAARRQGLPGALGAVCRLPSAGLGVARAVRAAAARTSRRRPGGAAVAAVDAARSPAPATRGRRFDRVRSAAAPDQARERRCRLDGRGTLDHQMSTSVLFRAPGAHRPPADTAMAPSPLLQVALVVLAAALSGFTILRGSSPTTRG